MAIDKYIIEGGKIAVYNHYQLRLRGLESKQPGVMLSVAKFSSSEAISQIPRYEIEFTCTQKDLPAQWVVNYPALFLMYPDGKPYESVKPRIVPGLITSFRQCSTTADETRYVVVLEHRMALLDQGRNNAVWQNDSIISLTEKVLNHHQFDRLDFRFSLEDPYPQHEFMLQYGESDGQHIARRLTDGGVSFYFEYDEENDSDVIIFADHSYAWKRGLAIPFRHPAGLFDGGMESVWDMSVSRQVIPKSMLLNDENYRQAQQNMGSTAENNPDYPALYGEDYRWGEHYPQCGKEYALAPGEGLWYAKRRQERWLTEQVTFVGKSTCMDLRPGMVITTPGKVWPDAPDGLLIVSTHCERASRDIAYWVTFTAIPWNQDHTYRPAEQPWPQVPGTLSARISSTVEKDTYAHLDPQGRYRIRFDLDLAEWKKGFESCWVRLAKPYGGDGYGFHWPLLDGTGVAIQFTDGNLDRPYIAHVLHDSRHSDHVNIENNKRNVLLTPAGNTLRMDDERGIEHIKLSTPHSNKSELSLGHIVDSVRKKRGEGFELRTDGWGAVRAGKGLFISTDLRAQAVSDLLDMREARQQLKDAITMTSSLREAAEIAKAELADLASQKSLLTQAIDEMKQSALLVSAPAGIAMTTPKTLQLNAEENLTLTARQQADISALKRITLAAGKAISLFARETGIKLFAAKGNVELQAQSDEMHLSSLKDMTISSHAGKTIVAAKDELLLTCGSAYIRLKGGQIEYGSPGNQTVKATNWTVIGPESMDITHPQFPQSVPKQALRFQLGGSPQSPTKVRANEPYKLFANGKLVQQGLTDAEGNIEIDHQIPTQKYRLEMISGERYDINMVNEGQEKPEDALALEGFREIDPGQTEDASQLGAGWRNTFQQLLNPQWADSKKEKEQP
ncbi:MAG: type VI secretion system tip protein VgrG [Rouxiella aceris]|uniref:type VI secretion system Vgr family protein n=1 Tax=Rouxiella aceris TaxID=2703884 RepID=UPI0028471AA5|nr:type VI secretion system tip protein VgrG [Rouxiella aceris]MDR3433885.1 type VI secretion system tip protein VgrG [Rouxiella aceris]